MDVTNDATWSTTPSDLKCTGKYKNNKAKISIPNNKRSSNMYLAYNSYIITY